MQIWKKLSTLFKASTPEIPRQPKKLISHEEWKVSTDKNTILDYCNWKKREFTDARLNWFINQYQIYKTSPKALDDTIDFLEYPFKKGFIYYNDYDKNESDVLHIFEWVTEKLLRKGYYSYVRDVKKYSIGDNIEIVERQYLKPKINYTELTDGTPIKQLWGNIEIERTFNKKRLMHIKFNVNTYQASRAYREADSIETLYNYVFTP